MHLKLDSSGGIDDGDVARDLGQDPADIVVLSAADSDLAAFGAAAFGRTALERDHLRVGVQLHVGQSEYSVDEVLRHAGFEPRPAYDHAG